MCVVESCVCVLSIHFINVCLRAPSLPSVRTGPQNPEGPSGGPGQRPGKDQTSRRKDEAKQAAKKPKEKENALSQFDLNNYASESHTHTH